ncbi:winged helix-turn-helix transcriptional regulator [Pseudovibrio sp. POLY-S9]|uniref:winged helix-turn-helix transcriptional regulator n=1 Tax=Pseudovibrio sp. POLY-S9 TaxID=1576596 RepID=UPI00070FC3FF|nr:winged helix-turn-helix transcriptional regulator [Pseudovibrio sp. POLY-S9]
MTTSDKRKFSHPPIGMHRDPDLILRDIQVMNEICTSTNRHGICRRSQIQIAKLLRISEATVRRSIQRLMKAGWLERRGGTRPDGGNCSYTYKVIFKDVQEDEQGDLLEPDLEEEAARYEERRYRNDGAPAASVEAYKNELLITVDDEGEMAASRANGEKPDVSSPAKVRVEGSFKRYANEVVSTLARLKPGLDVTRMAGGINPIMGWFTAGCDLDQDVKPALSIVLERAPALPNSLNYFTKAVVSAMKSRKELSEINPNYKNFGAQAAAIRAKQREADLERCDAAIDELGAKFAAGGAL